MAIYPQTRATDAADAEITQNHVVSRCQNPAHRRRRIVGDFRVASTNVAVLIKQAT